MLPTQLLDIISQIHKKFDLFLIKYYFTAIAKRFSFIHCTMLITISWLYGMIFSAFRIVCVQESHIYRICVSLWSLCSSDSIHAEIGLLQVRQSISHPSLGCGMKFDDFVNLILIRHMFSHTSFTKIGETSHNCHSATLQCLFCIDHNVLHLAWALKLCSMMRPYLSKHRKMLFNVGAL